MVEPWTMQEEVGTLQQQCSQLQWEISWRRNSPLTGTGRYQGRQRRGQAEDTKMLVSRWCLLLCAGTWGMPPASKPSSHLPGGSDFGHCIGALTPPFHALQELTH